MLTTLGRAAYWLDGWLRQHVGRLYTGILIWGLIVGIGASLTALGNAFTTGVGLGGKLAAIALAAAFQAALLINQLAQLYEHQERRRTRRKGQGDAAQGP
jgi:hypothetical protein